MMVLQFVGQNKSQFFIGANFSDEAKSHTNNNRIITLTAVTGIYPQIFHQNKMKCLFMFIIIQELVQ
ncbi:MAG: hypothetical protein ACD_62C00085G0004 [uncultured bacterium]|nr:MAG: hypothetical protein ACD_62C00085G0004 [uncultured bacterium]